MKVIDSEHEYLNTKMNILNDKYKHNLDNISSMITKYWYVKGFPYFDYNNSKKIKEFQRIIDYDVYKLELDNDELQQNMSFLGLANSYHPHMNNVRCGSNLTPYEIFNDINLLNKAVKKRITLSDQRFTTNQLRKSLKVFSGAKSVSNFKPTVSKYIYNKYVPIGGKILDPCCGYGGRLLGFLGSHCGEYHGVDPCVKTIQGNKNMWHDYKIFNHYNKKVRFFNNAFEDEIPIDDDYDLVFTSPPYYDTEKYDEGNPNQSWIKYKTYDKWKSGFLEVLVNKSYSKLKHKGLFALNIANVKSKHNIADDILEHIKLTFGKHNHIGTKYMRLSRMLGKGHNKTDKSIHPFKLEPIFIFQKIQI